MAEPRCRDCGSRKWNKEGRCAECRAFPTLGFAVLDLMEETCVIPDREDAGMPFIPTDEQGLIVLNHYRINPHVVQDRRGLWRLPFWYPRGTQVTKPQKWGKAPISAAVVCVEAHPEGPVLFDGWDAAGQPVGRPWPAPHIQITACSEDQSDNVWRVLQPMIELGDLADVFPDTGLTRINLPSGGLIEPVTASAISRLGQRIHLSVQDQTESWFANNGGHKLRDSQRRGLAGTGGRFFETPNAWDPTEQSVAQQTFEHEAGVYKTYAEPPAGSVRNKRDRRKVLKDVYGDSIVDKGGWIDLDRIDVEIEALLEHDPAQAERWFMNRCFASEGAAFDIAKWGKLAKPRRVPVGSMIVLGIDGARYQDAIAVVACEVKTGYVWPVIIIERPENAPDFYEHDFNHVDGAVRECFERYNVWKAYCDPHKIEALIEGWQNRYGEKRIVSWLTNRQMPIAWAVRNLEDAISSGDLTHSGDQTLTAHIRNARKRMLTVLDDFERRMHTLTKDSVGSPRKIDGAMALVLCREARGDCIASRAVNMNPSAPIIEPKQKVYAANEAPPADWFESRQQEVGPMGPLS